MVFSLHFFVSLEQLLKDLKGQKLLAIFDLAVLPFLPAIKIKKILFAYQPFEIRPEWNLSEIKTRTELIPYFQQFHSLVSEIRVITFGTYDLLHQGHVNLFELCRRMGETLIIGVSTDNFNEIKGKKAIQDFHQRRTAVELYGDVVFSEESMEAKIDYISFYQADLLIMGDDWAGIFDSLAPTFYPPRTPEISSTLLRSKLLSIKVENEDETVLD